MTDHQDQGGTNGDFRWNHFVEAIFNQPCQEPFSFNVEFINRIPDKNQLSQLLGYFISTGAKQIYSKELADLSAEEWECIRRYLLSIGWDVEYAVEQKTKKVVDYNPDGSKVKKDIPFNHINISFRPYHHDTTETDG
jgi:hypothetical protein